MRLRVVYMCPRGPAGGLRLAGRADLIFINRNSEFINVSLQIYESRRHKVAGTSLLHCSCHYWSHCEHSQGPAKGGEGGGRREGEEEEEEGEGVAVSKPRSTDSDHVSRPKSSTAILWIYVRIFFFSTLFSLVFLSLFAFFCFFSFSFVFEGRYRGWWLIR